MQQWAWPGSASLDTPIVSLSLLPSHLSSSRAAPYLDGVLFKDAQLQEDVQLDLPLVKQLFHLHLSIVQLLEDGLDVADRTTVRRLVVGYSGVPVAAWGKKRGRGLTMLKVTEEVRGGFPHLAKRMRIRLDI